MSVEINFYEHPFAGCAPQVFEARCVAEWLLERFGDVPKVNLQVYRGAASAETEVTLNFKTLQSTEAETFTVLQSPGSLIQGIQIAIIVFSVASALLASKPTQPSNVNRTSASPNNDLTGRSNQVRLLQRIEDIFGTVRSIPSLIMPTYNKYIDNLKVEYGFYCVGRGYHDISDVKDADTLISAVPSASAAVYAPFTSPNSGDAPQLLIGNAIIDRVQTVTRSEEVDGVTLAALNQLKFPDSAEYLFASTGVITQQQKNPNFTTLLDPGDIVVVTGATGSVAVGAEVTASNALSGFFGNFVIAPPDTGGGDGSGTGGGDGE